MMEEPSIGVNDFSFGEDDDGQDVLVDLDELWNVLEGPGPEFNQGSGEELSPTNIIEETSDGRTSSSEGFSESAGNSVASGERINPSLQLSLAEHSYDLSVQGNDTRSMHEGVGLQNSVPYIRNNISLDIPFPNHDDGMFGCLTTDARSEDLYSKELMEETDLSSYFGKTDDSSFMGGKKTSQDPFFFTSYDAPFLPHSSGLGSIASDDYITFDIMDDGKNDKDFTKSYNDLIRSECVLSNVKNENSNIFSLNSQVGAFDMHAVQMKPEIPSPNTLSNVYREVQNDFMVKKNIDAITSNDIVSRASEVIDDVISRKYYRGIGDPPSTGVICPSPNYSSLVSHSENYIPHTEDDKDDIVLGPNRTLLSLELTSGAAVKSSGVFARDPRSVLRRPSQPVVQPSSSVKAGRYSLKMEKEVPKPNHYCLSNTSYQGVQIKTLGPSNDDDDDVCILEDLSAPAVPCPTMMNAITSQFPTARIPDGQMVTGHSRTKPNDERIIYREALQDLSLPKLEATPPDGLLAVPLLKHQRIALFWMVNKETKSDTCCGGILADDQGLGKTVSTIALILKERSPSTKAIKVIDEQIKTETLNLDEDDEPSENQLVNERAKPCEVNPFLLGPGKACLQTKGRPSAGTLIVCPTSVLRQWSDELHNKVTSEANLSVLVYHGSNRTKDPLELAKYDVVVTTYAIVSMEVPKQPIVDEKEDMVGTPFQGYSSSKKRKQLGTMSGNTSSSKSKKSKKGNEDDTPESGPLAKVGWFRVVLDEAQSIKNHRTQVARACWGLRSKRRWCLSGTPIQNAVDDLYSYFRFLRHEPYAAFKTFCEQIKVPIHKSPRIGFKKLQAVLKTIMLRRTKGSLLDGEPIINLPPKTIELKQVDFSQEERDFYCTLEAESQAQFAEYAAKGTVKQNYVNILLMLLRLRQACDHPLLVKRISSKSKMASSINMAKKLPREKQIFLLNCVEGAICGICSDAPEDAVVASCGHIFCNQCICEHMLGDDSHCPTKNCKRHLNTSQIFSVSSLRSATSDQPCVENTPDCADSDIPEISEPRSLNCPQDSSKIKAALDLLLSLAKPDDIASEMDYDSENLASNMDLNPKNVVKIMGEKAIVFSQWTGMLDLLEACLKSSNIQYRRLDGTMHVTARDKAVKDFNTLPEVTIMIMSLKAASLGLNMVAACRVILLDLWWNPTTEDQAIDRAHRIGQTRPVSVFRLTVKDTVEDRILALQQRKREMVASAFGEDETGGQQTRLTVDDLKYLFGVH